MKNIKSLGQHWLKDRVVLEEIVDFAGINADDVVLEVGPGLGTLTSAILRRAKSVVAVEYDQNLANNLPKQFPGKDLTVVNQDILQFDLNSFPNEYKVIANLPYYITNKIINRFIEADNRPTTMTVLVQKEVAQRIAMINGSSILSLAVSIHASVELGPIVKANLFIPPPKVDSQIIKLSFYEQPLLSTDEQKVMRIIKIAFGSKRKKIKTTLASGFNFDKNQIIKILERANIDPECRAETLKIDDFIRLSKIIN